MIHLFIFNYSINQLQYYIKIKYKTNIILIFYKFQKIPTINKSNIPKDIKNKIKNSF